MSASDLANDEQTQAEAQPFGRCVRTTLKWFKDDALHIDGNRVAAVLDSRFASGSMGRHELAKAKEQYGKLTLESARRLMKFWQVRAADAPPKTG